MQIVKSKGVRLGRVRHLPPMLQHNKAAILHFSSMVDPKAQQYHTMQGQPVSGTITVIAPMEVRAKVFDMVKQRATRKKATEFMANGSSVICGGLAEEEVGRDFTDESEHPRHTCQRLSPVDFIYRREIRKLACISGEHQWLNHGGRIYPLHQ